MKPCVQCSSLERYKDGTCKACKEAYRQRNLARHKASIRRAQLRIRYGVSPEEWDAMAEVQSGKCAICKQVPKKLCVDHDHKSKKVRGLLCMHCNTALGYVEREGWLEATRQYLSRG